MCTRQVLESITDRMAQCYRSLYGDSLVRIILYGSYARGDYTEDSDVDMAAIVHGDRLALQDKLKFIWDDVADIGLEYDVIVSPTVIPYDEFEKYQKVLPYYRSINEEGIRIERTERE